MMGSPGQKAAFSEAWVKPSSHVGPVSLALVGRMGLSRQVSCFGLLCGQRGTPCKVRVAAAWRSHSFVCSDLLAPRTGLGSVIHSVQVG